MKQFLYLFIILMASSHVTAYDFNLYIWKYNGGGDWYEAKIGAKNFISFINKTTTIKVNPTPQVITLESSALQDCFFLYATGHGVLTTTPKERKYLKNFLIGGGFLYLNDDYGMDIYIRRLIAELFPDQTLQSLPKNHLLFNIFNQFPNGPPKIHEHDGKSPEALAIFYQNRMVVLYTYECDIIDGWAPYQTHKDPEDLRTKALQFGVNIIYYAMTQ